MRTLFSNIGLLMVCLWTASAQDASLVTSVEPSRVASGEQFTVSFTFAGSEMPDSKNFRPPDFGQFVVMSGPNLSQSMQFINGRMSASVSFTYYLYARQTGKFAIGSASLEHRGKTLKSDPVQVEVVQGKPKQQAAPEAESSDIGENLFVRAIPTKFRVKQGEQLTVLYKMYTRVGVSDYSLSKVPTYEGFWSEDFELPKVPEVTAETHEGKQYRVVTLRKTALFATQTGSLKLAPLKVRCAVQVQSRRRTNDPFDVFDDPFFSRFQTAEYEIGSNPLTILVDPLPARAPEGFGGAVGKFSFSVALNKNEVRAGDPLTLRVTVSGSGNVKLVPLPKPVFPSDVELYEPKISDEISREGGVVRGKKAAEYLFIPRNAGKRAIEPIAFTYFDLEKNSYITHRSQPLEIIVSPGRELAAGGPTVASKEDVRLLGEDIRFLKLDVGSVRKLDQSPFEAPWFILGVTLPPILFLGAFVYRKRMETISGDLSAWRSRKAGKEASRRLKYARKMLATGDSVSYHAEISRALLGYLSDKLRIPQASLSLETAVATLGKRGVDPEAIQKVQSCIERADYARFAPGSDTQEARRDLLEAAAEAINNLEDSLNGR